MDKKKAQADSEELERSNEVKGVLEEIDQLKGHVEEIEDKTEVAKTDRLKVLLFG